MAGNIRAGESAKGTFGAADQLLEDRGPSKRFELRAEADGAVTIELKSFQVNAFLRVETEGGENVAEAEEGCWGGLGGKNGILSNPGCPVRLGAGTDGGGI